MAIDKNEIKRLEREKAFLERAKEMNRDYIDYSKVHYINNRTLVTFIDKEYGEFQMTPSNFLKGQDCKQRKGAKISNTKGEKYNTEWFIKRAREVHGDLYDYSKTVYTGAHNKVIIIDPEYGEFEQEANSHLRGAGHPQRGIEKYAEKERYTNETFIAKCKEIQPNADYDFSLVEYVDSRTNVKIFCNKIGANGKPHGVFEAMPCNLLQGKGCPKCGRSISVCEDELYNFLSQYTTVIKRDKTILEGKEIDLYLPEYNIGIEYNGCLFHSEKYGKDRNYHLNKTIQCNEKGIGLIQIFEDEYKFNRELIKHKLKHILHLDNDLPKVNGSECEVRVINEQDAMSFLNEYHIQGFVYSTLYIGAFYNDELVSVMTFKKDNKSDYWELNRMCSKWNYVYRGIASKLLQFFIKNYDPIQIKSFADRRWTVNKDSNLYTALGFTLEKIEKPNYTYYNPNVDTVKRFHKFGFRKKILNKKYRLSFDLTETEMTKSLGYYKVWDCGLFKFVWKKEERN